METNYREMLKMPTLKNLLGVENLKSLNLHQKKAVRNIKFCANDQWQFVNSWMDHHDEDARAYVLNPEELFDTIYSESQENIYDEGFCSFGAEAKSWLKDIKFCGKKFLEHVCFYYVVKFLEESIEEVDGTEEENSEIVSKLTAMYDRIFSEDKSESPKIVEEILQKSLDEFQSAENFMSIIADMFHCKLKYSKGVWFYCDDVMARSLQKFFKQSDQVEYSSRSNDTQVMVGYKGCQFEIKVSGNKSYFWYHK